MNTNDISFRDSVTCDDCGKAIPPLEQVYGDKYCGDCYNELSDSQSESDSEIYNDEI